MNQKLVQALKKQESKWFILRGENKFGPFEYMSVLGMIQNGELFDYNYIWSSHLEGWMPLGEVPEFSKDRLSLLIKTQDPLSLAFHSRGSHRADVQIPVFCHNEDYFFDGYTTSISVNGSLVLLNNPLLLPGQKLMLHFKECEQNPKSFNVSVQIVRKNFSRQRLNVKSGIHYAVKFLQIQEWGEAQLKHLVTLYQEVNEEGTGDVQ
ncbi:MAG: PilZ domain-containing protein [Deltaproteobacteria bacterium]|jgi:hypothetical protein|nr:PilZ domain-containing protein [Deltaproteobacteria bacterium]